MTRVHGLAARFEVFDENNVNWDAKLKRQDTCILKVQIFTLSSQLMTSSDMAGTRATEEHQLNNGLPEKDGLYSKARPPFADERLHSEGA